jgi:hypothetical protein
MNVSANAEATTVVELILHKVQGPTLLHEQHYRQHVTFDHAQLASWHR